MSFSSDDLVKVMIIDQKLQLHGDANMHVSHIYDYRSKAAAAWGCEYAYLTYL
jgi:hypothetical protein